MGTRFRSAAFEGEIVELRQLSARELAPLLDEEVAIWRERLDWDFSKSAALVRRFAGMRALSGAALVEDGDVTGYVYYVVEEHKGLVGDLYVRRKVRSEERENALLEWALDAIAADSRVRRVESQLMMFPYRRELELPRSSHLSAFERNFMRIDLAGANLPEAQPGCTASIERWLDAYQDSAAGLISNCYRSHVDSLINDQYRSREAARRFLFNVVQYPGCGVFFRPGSLAAFHGESEKLQGISLASVVAPECGHITQLCVEPEARGQGLGYELIRRSLESLAGHGCARASLTVTVANAGAVALYERMGFETIHRFPAYVWEGF